MLSHRRCARCESPEGERGFTLTELLIVLLILAAIIGPISGAFITSYRATKDVSSSLSNSFDSQLLANYFTSDVQSAEGAHNPEVYAALTADPPVDPNDVNLNDGVCGGITDDTNQWPVVTLAWNTTSQGRPTGTLAERVSYVVEGRGAQSTLVRRYCVGTNVYRYVVGQDFGVKGEEFDQLVHGADAGDPFNSVCTAYTCTIVIEGTANYSLTVERRVPGPDAAIALLTPNPPVSVTAESLNESASVTWPASVLSPGQGTVLGYQVLAYVDDAGDPAICQNQVLPEGVGPAVTSPSVGSSTLQNYVSPLTNGVGYCFRVRARNAAGWGPPSAPSNIIVPAPSPPPPPLNLAAVPGDQSLTITWDHNSNTGGFALIGYSLNINPVPAGVSVPITIDPTIEEITFSCPDECLINGTTYTVSIAGFNSKGTGPVASVTGRPYGPADPPANVTMRAGGIGDEGALTSAFYKGGLATATWSAVTGAGLQGGTLWGYRISAFELGTTEPAVSNQQAGAAVTGMVGCTNSALPCLVNGRAYQIRVAALTSTVSGVNCTTTPASCTLGEYSDLGVSSAPAGRETIVPSGPPAAPTNVRLSYFQSRDWQTANVNTSWKDEYTLVPGLTPPQPERPAWNGAPPIKYRVDYRSDPDRDIDTGEQPPGAWGAWTPLATLNATDVYEWSAIQGGAWYQFRVVAINRGEWFSAGNLDRLGTPSDPADTQVTGTQGFNNVFYAVTKPDVPPGVNPALILGSNDSSGRGCLNVRRQGYSGTYSWDSSPLPQPGGAPDPNDVNADYWNGVKWDYRHVIFRFRLFDRTTGADLTPSVGLPTWAERTTIATGDRYFCSNAFRGNRRVEVQVSYGGYDAPGESLYNPALLINGMIQGNYSSPSAQINVSP